MSTKEFLGILKKTVIGGERDLGDNHLFHKVSLIALLAWVGLGADGLSSSCYGPEEAFKALGSQTHLSIFVALATVITITIICASYSQIIELFPTGGGGYLVASKLLSPTVGVVSGCALVVDYVLTIAISIASGADAVFSLLPVSWQHAKLISAMLGLGFLTVINLRGVKESVVVFLPVFATFVLTHLFVILYVTMGHTGDFVAMCGSLPHKVAVSHKELGLVGMIALILRSYSMGAGTFTGIEAVSNAMPMLREPRVKTGKRTMLYMGLSLGLTVAGLLVAYLVYSVAPHPGKTLNAVLFEQITQAWPGKLGFAFVLVTLASEAGLLFIAAQTGFLGGPSVMASMAMDRWLPTRFATLSDRFVTQNGVLLMGAVAAVVMYLTGGDVTLLVVLYSINVFITFTLSQLGMVRHWWQVRGEYKTPAERFRLYSKLFINGTGCCLTVFILASLCYIKFFEGGWITLLITGLLIAFAFRIHRHYGKTFQHLSHLDELVEAAEKDVLPDQGAGLAPVEVPAFNPKGKTAVILVSGFNGLGLHTLYALMRMFPGVFKNFIFLKVGIVDAGNFKGAEEIEKLRQHNAIEVERYVQYMRRSGFYAEGLSGIGTDIVTEVAELAPQVIQKYPQAVFAGGQLVFPEDRFVYRLLHNYAVFAIQRRLYQAGYPFLVLPIRV